MFNRRPKYGATRVVIDGVKFDSKREARRWGELTLLQKAGTISDLRRQVTYRLEVNGMLVCKYVADAVYVENGAEVVEDTKAVRTRAYGIKKKLMLACWGVKIRET